MQKTAFEERKVLHDGEELISARAFPYKQKIVFSARGQKKTGEQPINGAIGLPFAAGFAILVQEK